MPKSPNASRVQDLQSLKQASACLAQAITFFADKEDASCMAQVELAWRFLDEFIDKRGDG